MRSQTLIGMPALQPHVRYDFVIHLQGRRSKPGHCIGTDREEALHYLGEVVSSCERLGATLEVVGKSHTNESSTRFGKDDRATLIEFSKVMGM